MSEVHEWLYNIHAMTQKSEWFIEKQLDRLAALNDCGWAPETILMRDLDRDAKILRALARQLDDMREKMTTTQEATT